MDDVLCDYKNAYALAAQSNPDIKYPQSQIDFYRKLKPIDGAIEGFNITGLASGTYMVTLKKAGYADQVVTISVNDGEMTVLNVQLEK